MTPEQDEIRDCYLEINAGLENIDRERARLAALLVALQARCFHPRLGRGTLPGERGGRVEQNECPDCGLICWT
ncbi:hypothetical protein J8F10_15565 [Gemmata sp. G18]|uniref:Uncharacterized protein n=1 Tax=Gemmata palustris TaxID=2822762 RepID=A0ABS5BSH1_9BACT|nr:hypothetical protein [Gemmata palustris]MBP3956692.1 hypothetical protein [Gemmata palustris]